MEGSVYDGRDKRELFDPSKALAKNIKTLDDEKKIKKVNRRNDSWTCRDPNKLLTVMHTKFLATVVMYSLHKGV